MNNSIDNKAIISNLIRVMRMHRKYVEREVSELGIHNTQHHLLMYLAENEEIPSQKDLCEKFHVSPAAMAVSMKKLEKNGYIERISSDDDSRIKKIVILNKGKEMIEMSKIMFNKIDSETFEGITHDEIVLFDSILEKMQYNLDKKINSSEETK